MKTIAAALTFSLAVTGSAFAARSSMPDRPQNDPHAQAVSDYESGERRLDKAAKIASDIKSAADPAAAAKLQDKLNKTLDGAVGDFKRAVRNDPNLFQAYSEMGFALRKLGRYDDSLAAYEQALQLQPGFSPAIEYRAEAHLALNRVEEARQAYLALFSGDRPRADLLLRAMKQWATDRQADAAGVDATQVEQFSQWVAQRETIHSQTAGATTSANLRTW